MCEPVSVTLGAVALVGGVAKGVADHQAANANAAAKERNAAAADMAASDALQRGEVEASRVQMRGEAAAGQQVAGYAAQGVDVGSGSAERTAEDTAAITALDTAATRNNAQREAWGMRTQAVNLRNEAKQDRKSGDYALVGGVIGGVASGAGAAVSGLAATGYFKPTPQAPGTLSF